MYNKLLETEMFCFKSVRRIKESFLLFKCHFCTYDPLKTNSTLKTLLYQRIKGGGPITIADYMRIVLTYPYSGYYMHKDVFGTQGDFTTSPEISQLFGELLAVWIINEWHKIGSPKPLQLVELGPGRGTLMQDILRVFTNLKLGEGISIHLVELSPHLSELQEKTLCAKNITISPAGQLHLKQGIANDRYPVYWYSKIEDVPREFSCILAHEFFDALPIHKFQKINGSWREIFVDILLDEVEMKFQYVLSNGETAASTAFIQKNENRSHVEISPESGIIIEHIAGRLEENGGFSLIVDYGSDGTSTDTFRAFQKHKIHDPLTDPGTADLTADVDFSYLKKFAEPKLVTFGPVTQQKFLRNMAIELRLEMLLKNASPSNKELIKSGYHMIMDSDKMGERFKFFALFPSVLKEHLSKFPVAGFTDLY